MKRNLLIKHLNKFGCTLRREGANHSVYENSEKNTMSTVPRHPDVSDLLANTICVYFN
jgi:predicted RNA binding protein YcfA (HicA-like mRNA interferase family)